MPHTEHYGPKLSPWLLERAYSQGIFPMAMEDGSVEWFRPRRRAILPLDGFLASHSLRKSAKKYEVRFDTSYEKVMRACARPDETWITEEFVRVYTQMFLDGKGHCSEAWLDGELVGGVYGVAFGTAFMAESMFHTATDAGKVALWKLVEKLCENGYELLDVQYMTPHLRSLGAVQISHSEYMRRLSCALDKKPDW